MVFESVVTDILNKVLGSYIENLDTKQLRLGIWGGDVVLTDLLLKQSALKELDLPVQTVYGRLAKLTLKIPWKNIYYESVEATVEGLYLLVEPNSQVEYNAEKEANKLYTWKQKQLEYIETARKRELEAKGKKVDATFVEKLTTQIIKNVQVNIKNIHIRYEDKITNPSYPFAMGVTLSNLSVQTTDDKWLPAIVYDEKITKIFKVVELQGLAVYWNSKSALYREFTPDKLVTKLQEDIATKTSSPNEYTYILGPIHSAARMKLNPRPDRDTEPFTIPKVVTNWEMEKLAIAISKDQYRDIIGFSDGMALMMRGEPYRKYRPHVPYKGHYKEWWHFAYNCILEFEVQRRFNNWNWNHILTHRQKCREYSTLYKTKLLSKKVSPEVEEQLNQIEKDLDVMNIMLVRQKIKVELDRLGKSQEQTTSKGWFGGWWGKSTQEKSDPSTDLVAQIQAVMTPEEKQRFYKAIDYQENTAPAVQPLSFVDMVFAFVLQKLEVKVYNEKQNVLTTQLLSVKCKLETRTSANAFGVHMNINQMSVIGIVQDDYTPKLISSNTLEDGDLCDVLYETNPLDSKCGQKLHVSMKPLKIIYDAVTINGIVDQFTIPQSSTLQQLSTAATSTLDSVKLQSSAGLQYVIDQHTQMDIAIDLYAPYVIIPYGGIYTETENILAVNLGHAKLVSVDQQRSSIRKKQQKASSQKELVSVLMEESYDQFLLEFSDLQIMIVPGGEDWLKIWKESTVTSFHILLPLSLNLEIYNCLIDNDPRLPRCKIFGALPSMSLNITDYQLVLLLGLLKSIPFPEVETTMDIQITTEKPLRRPSSQTLQFFDFNDKEAQTAFETHDEANATVSVSQHYTTLELYFIMKELNIIAKHQEYSGSAPEEVGMLTLQSLEANVKLQTHVQEVYIKLENLMFNKYHNNKQVAVISTPVSNVGDYLFEVRFISVDKKSPEFTTVHKSCESLLIVNFEVIKLRLHQQVLTELIKYGTDLQLQLEEVMETNKPKTQSTSKSSLMRRMSEISEGISRTSTNYAQKRSKAVLHGTYIQTILFKLDAKLHEFQVVIGSDAGDFSSMSLKNIMAQVILKEAYTQVNMVLKDINVMDLNPNTKYFNILTVLSDEVINFKLILYNKQVDTSRGEDMEVAVSFGCIRIIFLNLFVSTMLDFLNRFQAAQAAIVEASLAAADKAKQNVTNIYENAIQIAINIDLKAPQIIVPERSDKLNALIFDFGHLIIQNKFVELNIKNEHGQNAVIDDMELKLTDVQLSRIQLNNSLEITNRIVILQPVNLSLLVKRNLSCSWYTAIPNIHLAGQLEKIEVVVGQPDYGAIMATILGNLSEVGVEPEVESATTILKQPSPSSLDQVNKPVAKSSDLLSIKEPEMSTKPAPKEEDVHIIVKFNLVMDTFTIKLLAVEDIKEDQRSFVLTRQNLAMFSLEGLSVKGRVLSDTTIHTSVLLVDCVLQDTRLGKEDMLNKMFSRAHNYAENEKQTPFAYKSMIDVIYQQKEQNMYLDLKVSGFNLILSMEFLSKLQAFLMTAFSDEHSAVQPSPGRKPVTAKSTTVKSVQAVSRGNSMVEDKTVKNMTINIRLEKPDIVLVEHLNNIDTNALILNCELLMKVRLSGDHQVINGITKDIQMYTCCYNPALRETTKHLVLSPFTVSVAGSTPEGKGLHIEVCLTEIHIKVSPATIELLNRAQVTMLGTEQDTMSETETLGDLSEVWLPKIFQETNFWFFRTELAEDAIDLLATTITTAIPIAKKQNEMCIITLPLLVVTIEVGEGRSTLPVLILESRFEGNVQNWSSEMVIDATITLQMAYYNSRVAVWEPLIEPVGTSVETGTAYKPWELKMDISMNTLDQDVTSPQSDIDIETAASQAQPKMSIEFSSRNNLELTISKTTLEVMLNLSNAFANAVTLTTLKPPIQDSAPYKFINESGLQVRIDCEKSSFSVYQNTEAKEVILENGAEVSLQLKEVDKINLTLNEILANLSIHNKYLYITVIEMNYEIKLNLVRSDTRYFSLNYRGENRDTWGVITSTIFEEGTYKVILSSIIKIYNHLQVPVDVYYMTPRGNELECIGSIEPDGVFNVPINAVYTPTNELFFSVQNYSVSSKPFVWKDLHLNVNQTQMLQCLPMATQGHSEAFVIKAISSIQQVYNENSIKRTMNSILCNVHIHSPVLFRNCLPYDVLLAVQNIDEEMLIKPGCTLTVANVTPEVSYIVVRLPSYLEKEWSCVRDITSNPSQFAVWTFDSYDSTIKVSLDLGVHSIDDGGPLLMTIYCPFWMINKSELNIAYRSSDENLNILHHPANFKGPVLFSFNAKNFFGKKKASIKIENGGEWSDKFSIDVAGSSGVITCKYEEKIYQFGVNIQLTYNGLTKQVTFTPYYVLINNAYFSIECQEHDRPADPWTIVKPSSCSALWPVGDFDDKLLRIRVVGTTEVSPPFYISDSHTSVLKLANKYGGVHVDTQITEGAIYITFSKYDIGMAPALIINNTKNTLNIWEKDTVHLIKLDPGYKMYYTWSNPSGARVLCWEAGYKKEVEDDLRKDGCGEYPIADNNYVYWASFLDGMQRTLLFTCNQVVAGNAHSSQILEKIDQEVVFSIFGVGLSLINNNLRQEIMYVGIASSGIMWETCKYGSNRYKQMSSRDSDAMESAYRHYLNMKENKDTADEVCGRMVIDAKTEVNFDTNEMLRPNMRKIRRTFLTGLWVQITTNPYLLQLHAKVNRLQIDNQIYDCMFPVVLAPVTLPKSVVGTDVHKPFAELSIVQMLIKHSQIKQFKYFKILIQEFHIKLELGFVNAISEVFQLSQDTLDKQKTSFLLDADFVNQPLYEHVSQQSLQEQKSFYDLLHFSPLKIHVSFSLGGGAQDIAPNIVTVLLQSLGVTLTDMQDVIFRIAYFEREYTFLTQKQLVSEATSHYIGQAVKQLYALVLGLDVLGNPYGLVLGITKGVEDLFYEPFQGAIQGPGEFAEGLALGVRSLFGHTVGGAAGAVSRITGAMGKGIAALTFDKEYQRKRRDAVNKKATTVSEGFARSGKGLVMGVYDGLTGVVRKPISGAKEQGVGGFFKGLGKGAVGLVARPTSGVIDFASSSLETVKRVTDLTAEEVHRLRASRYIYSDGLIRPYSEIEAIGNKILLELEKGKYASTDFYQFHFYIVAKKEVLMLTDKRLLYVTHSDLFGFWQVEWSYTWQEINIPPKIGAKGVSITSIEPKKKKMGSLFASADVGKTILISDPRVAEAICEKITEVHKLQI